MSQYNMNIVFIRHNTVVVYTGWIVNCAAGLGWILSLKTLHNSQNQRLNHWVNYCCLFQSQNHHPTNLNQRQDSECKFDWQSSTHVFHAHSLQFYVPQGSWGSFIAKCDV